MTYFFEKMKSENSCTIKQIQSVILAMNSQFCIFINTICQGRIPAWHDEKDLPIVYPTIEAAQREIADDVIENLRQFLAGEREFEDALTVEDYILSVDVLPDGSILDEDGNHFGKKEF
jgi:hypothetical protein